MDRTYLNLLASASVSERLDTGPRELYCPVNRRTIKVGTLVLVFNGVCREDDTTRENGVYRVNRLEAERSTDGKVTGVYFRGTRLAALRWNGKEYWLEGTPRRARTGVFKLSPYTGVEVGALLSSWRTLHPGLYKMAYELFDPAELKYPPDPGPNK